MSRHLGTAGPPILLPPILGHHLPLPCVEPPSVQVWSTGGAEATMIGTVITAVHTMLFSSDPEATRTFLREVVQLPYADTGGGWLIFRTGPSELGVHPASWEHEGQPGATDQRHDVSLMCDDLAATMTELAARGARFDGDVQHQRWGSTVQIVVPGAGTMTLYSPTYPPPALATDDLLQHHS